MRRLRTLVPLLSVLSLTGLSISALTAPSLAQEPTKGQAEFMSKCASCHGADGKGTGPVAEFLKPSVPDLTRLAEINDGVFPFVRAVRIIDGRADVAAHGDRAMPVWGARYSVEVGPDYQPTNPEATEAIVHGRILQLVNYLWSIQTVRSDDDSLLP